MHRYTTPNQRETQTYDVIVVGGRCAGAATAMLLARDGFDVAIVDRATFPSDTLSTHSLSRGGVVQLNRWGLLDAVLDSGAPAIRRVELHSPKGVLAKTLKDTASFLKEQKKITAVKDSYASFVDPQFAAAALASN